MPSSIINSEDDDRRLPDNSLPLPFGAEAQTQPVPGGAAAGPCPEVPAVGSVRVRAADVPPGTPSVSVALDPAGVSQLVLGMLVLVIQLARSSRLVEDVDAVAKGRMPGDIHGAICGLLRGALVGCSQVNARRRNYAAALLPAIPGLVTANTSVRVLSCATTGNGYDLLVMAGDGSTAVVSVVLPSHMIVEVCVVLLDTAATVVTVPAMSAAQACIRDVASGHYPQPLTDAIASAIVGALVTSPGLLSDPRKNAFLGLDSVSALAERIYKPQTA